MKRAIFLDKDGVLSKVVIREGLVASARTKGETKLLEGIAKSIGQLRDRGFMIIVVTNQPDISRGAMTLADFEDMASLIQEKVRVDDIFMCPHDDSDQCQCRKPKPGLILSAVKKHSLNISSSYFVGDMHNDMLAAAAAGCRGLLIDAPYNKKVAGYPRFKDLPDVAKYILEQGEK